MNAVALTTPLYDTSLAETQAQQTDVTATTASVVTSEKDTTVGESTVKVQASTKGVFGTTFDVVKTTAGHETLTMIDEGNHGGTRNTTVVGTT